MNQRDTLRLHQNAQGRIAERHQRPHRTPAIPREPRTHAEIDDVTPVFAVAGIQVETFTGRRIMVNSGMPNNKVSDDAPDMPDCNRDATGSAMGLCPGCGCIQADGFVGGWYGWICGSQSLSHSGEKIRFKQSNACASMHWRLRAAPCSAACVETTEAHEWECKTCGYLLRLEIGPLCCEGGACNKCHGPVEYHGIKRGIPKSTLGRRACVHNLYKLVIIAWQGNLATVECECGWRGNGKSSNPPSK